jgi:NAD(P)-dependent dehydrogenase (short-subunit alcohol dehydrogenase family)
LAAGHFVFMTGTGPIGPDGKVKGDTIEEQTAVTLDNIAWVLAVEGAGVVLLDVEAETLDRTTGDLQAKGWRVEGVAGDVASRADVRRAVELAVERFGRLDALVGVAGITEFAPVLEVSDESWRRILDVNLTGMFVATSMRSSRGWIRWRPARPTA